MFIFCPTWFQTAKGIIENFLSVVQTYGLVPNGGRIYYLKRSQPPFLTLMLKVSVRIPNLTAGTGSVAGARNPSRCSFKEYSLWESLDFDLDTLLVTAEKCSPRVPAF